MEPDQTATLQVHSEARGPHWVAWLTGADGPAKLKSVIVVGKTREEAEERARKWVAGAARAGYV